MQRSSFFAISIGVVLAIVTRFSVAADYPKTPEQPWKTYRDIEHGFQISYPSDGQIVTKHPTDVRIQNYTDVYSEVLKPGQFYLTLHFQDLPSDCTGLTPSMKRKLVGRAPVFTEHIPDEGDAGGDSFVLCAVRHNHVVSVSATENNKRVSLARKIIGTFKFSE